MKLSTMDLIKLLPEWMREDAAIRGLARGTEQSLIPLAERLHALSQWQSIGGMTEAELDEMAWELNIPWYDSTAGIDTKRAVIRNSDKMHARLGTKWSVEQILKDYLRTGYVQEWFEYGGLPQHFKLFSDNPEVTNDRWDYIVSLLGYIKRKSAYLDTVMIGLTGNTPAYAGIAVHEHDHTTYSFGLDTPLTGEGG